MILKFLHRRDMCQVRIHVHVCSKQIFEFNYMENEAPYEICNFVLHFRFISSHICTVKLLFLAAL